MIAAVTDAEDHATVAAPNASLKTLEDSVKQLVDVLALQAAANHAPSAYPPRQIVCNFCHKIGHQAIECRTRHHGSLGRYSAVDAWVPA